MGHAEGGTGRNVDKAGYRLLNPEHFISNAGESLLLLLLSCARLTIVSIIAPSYDRNCHHFVTSMVFLFFLLLLFVAEKRDWNWPRSNIVDLRRFPALIAQFNRFPLYFRRFPTGDHR